MKTCDGTTTTASGPEDFCVNCSESFGHGDRLSEIRIDLDTQEEEDLLLSSSSSSKRLRRDSKLLAWSSKDEEKEEKFISVKIILSDIYNLNHFSTTKLEDDVRLCSKCENIVSALYKGHRELNKIRKSTSYLATKIQQFDSILRRISEQPTHQDVDNESTIEYGSNDFPTTTTTTIYKKVNSRDNLNPFVKLTRLTPAEISESVKNLYNDDTSSKAQRSPTDEAFHYKSDDDDDTEDKFDDGRSDQDDDVPNISDMQKFHDDDHRNSIFHDHDYGVKKDKNISTIATEDHRHDAPQQQQAKTSSFEVKYHGCPKCHMSFLSKCGLQSHLFNVHEKTNRTTVVQTTSSPRLGENSAGHENSQESHDTPMEVAVEIIIESGSSFESENYGQGVSPASQNFYCPFCHITIFSKEGLVNHMYYIHNYKNDSSDDEMYDQALIFGTSPDAVSYTGIHYGLLDVQVPSGQLPSHPKDNEKIGLLVFRRCVIPLPRQSKSAQNEYTVKGPLDIKSLCRKAHRFYCQLCKRPWTNGEEGTDFFTHLKLHSCHFCHVCPDTPFFLNNSDWKTHMMAHDPSIIFQECPKCSSVYFEKDELDIHVNGCCAAKGQQEIRYPHPPSQQIYPTVLPHIQEVHTGKAGRRNVEQLKCPTCSKMFESKHIMCQHQANAHGRKKLQCPDCPRSFFLEGDLKQHHLFSHVQQQHPPTRKKPEQNEKSSNQAAIKCKMCDKEFHTKFDFYAHKLYHKKRRLYKCTVEKCSVAYTNLSRLLSHERAHRPSTHSLEDPYEQLTKIDELKGQKRKTSKSKLAHSCTRYRCRSNFQTAAELENHMSTCKGLERSVMCDVCSKTFFYPSTLTRHMRTHSEEPKMYPCAQCDKSFRRKGRLVDHERTHGTEKTILCNVEGCHMTFFTIGALRAHLELHKEKFLCTICGHCIRRKKYFEVHMMIHANDLPYSCEFCEKRFPTQSFLKRHTLTHTQETTSFICNTCGKKLRNRENLRTHIRIHTGEKPYVCMVCGSAFQYRHALKKHKLTHEQPVNMGREKENERDDEKEMQEESEAEEIQEGEDEASEDDEEMQEKSEDKRNYSDQSDSEQTTDEQNYEDSEETNSEEEDA